jgi:hypothetical protein
MRNIFLLLISTAITSLGIARLESVENSSSKIIGNLTKVVWIDAQETKGNLLLENSLVAGLNFLIMKMKILQKKLLSLKIH